MPNSGGTIIKGRAGCGDVTSGRLLRGAQKTHPLLFFAAQIYLEVLTLRAGWDVYDPSGAKHLEFRVE